MTIVVIAKHVQDQTRRIYWTGVCQSTGLPTWSYDRGSAVRMLAGRCDAWLKAVLALDPSGGDVQVVEDWA